MQRRFRHPAELHQGVGELDALPGTLHRDGVALVFEIARPQHRFGGDRQQFLDEIHHAAVVPVGGVELEHRELGVVLGRHPLVAEVPVELVDALEPPDQQPLEVQLGGNAQEQIDIEGVVVGREGPRQRAAVLRLHDRRFHLDESAGVQMRAQGAQRRGAAAKHLAHVVVGGQVKVALAIANLGVLQAVPLLGQRPQGLGQQGKTYRP